jgi:hypothetical protein
MHDCTMTGGQCADTLPISLPQYHLACSLSPIRRPRWLRMAETDRLRLCECDETNEKIAASSGHAVCARRKGLVKQAKKVTTEVRSHKQNRKRGANCSCSRPLLRVRKQSHVRVENPNRQRCPRIRTALRSAGQLKVRQDQRRKRLVQVTAQSARLWTRSARDWPVL